MISNHFGDYDQDQEDYWKCIFSLINLDHILLFYVKIVILGSLIKITIAPQSQLAQLQLIYVLLFATITSPFVS